MELGIAGWSLHQEILRDKTITLLDLPGVFAGFGVEVIELNSPFFESTSPEYLNKVRESIERAGVRVVSIAVDVGNLAEPDEAVRRTHVEALKQWFHVAKAVGSEAIRINSGRTAEETTTEVLDRIVAGYRELAGHAETTGVRLLLENHGGPSSDPKSIRYLLDQVNSEWFRTCPDFGNFQPEVTYVGLEAMLPYAYAVHAKLYTLDPSGRQVLDSARRHSEFDLGKCLELVKDSGFDGPLCLEWEGIKGGLELVRRFM